LIVALLLSSSLSTLILGGTEYTLPFMLILSASAILNFTALYGADMLGLEMYLEVAIQNIALILISKALGLAQGWADITILYALTGRPAVTGIYYLASAGATLLAIFWVAISMVILPLMSSEEARVGKPYQAYTMLQADSSTFQSSL
jgi:hypothetical protein